MVPEDPISKKDVKFERKREGRVPGLDPVVYLERFAPCETP